MRCSKGFVWTNKKLREKKKRTDSNNTTHTTMGTLEDVEGRVSYGATRLFHHVWLSRGSLWPGQIPQDFHPKQGAAAASPWAQELLQDFFPSG